MESTPQINIIKIDQHQRVHPVKRRQIQWPVRKQPIRRFVGGAGCSRAESRRQIYQVETFAFKRACQVRHIGSRVVFKIAV